MIIKSVEIEKFRAFENVSFDLGKRITAIAGRNATQKTTLLGMIGQPFTISKDHPMYGCKTIDGYNFRSQFKEKFKISSEHDIIGQHIWKLNFHNNVCTPQYYKVESIARKQSGKLPSLRFWNAESRSRGAGYIQLPVYFLSLSRLFPIGESGKTKKVSIKLTEDELHYCINNYRTILSIQNMNGYPKVGVEKGSTSKIFAGVSDETHDIFTNSAGEGNVTRIILAVISFKRLKEKYGHDYKGGVLLIDELDATLYSFSQKKLIDYLWKAAEEYKIQIIFTTHSPIILKQINKYQRKERRTLDIKSPCSAFGSAIVYLEPKYDNIGNRTIVAKNILTSSELNQILQDINLAFPLGNTKLNVYCEDFRAISFLKYILSCKLKINLESYMSFVDINLGWTNYVYLIEKKVPEFKKNMIILDGDVLKKKEFSSKKEIIKDSGNVIFLPLTIEQDIFSFLKQIDVFLKFKDHCSEALDFNYDVCFNNWPLDANEYRTNDFKQWYNQLVSALGNETILFDFWCKEHQDKVKIFIDEFVDVFNKLAEENAFDGIPVCDNK